MGSVLRLILPIKASTDYPRSPNQVRTSQPFRPSMWGRRVTDGLVEARPLPARQSDQSFVFNEYCAIVAVDYAAILPGGGKCRSHRLA